MYFGAVNKRALKMLHSENSINNLIIAVAKKLFEYIGLRCIGSLFARVLCKKCLRSQLVSVRSLGVFGAVNKRALKMLLCTRTRHSEGSVEYLNFALINI